MSTGAFESGCVAVESALDDLDKRLRDVVGRARRLRAAAKSGDVKQLRDGLAKLAQDEASLGQAIARTSAAWPFDEAAESDYLRTGYASELVQCAAERGLTIHDRDGRLLAFPALLRVDVPTRRVRVNKRPLASLRPSAMVAALRAIQAKGDGVAPQSFLAMLFRAWRIHTGGSAGTGNAASRQVSLMAIHDTLTLLPSARKDYDLTEFGRDLLLLDESGATRVTADKIEYEVHLARAATSSKGGRFVSTVDRDGQQIGYAAIEFTAVMP